MVRRVAGDGDGSKVADTRWQIDTMPILSDREKDDKRMRLRLNKTITIRSMAFRFRFLGGGKNEQRRQKTS